MAPAGPHPALSATTHSPAPNSAAITWQKPNWFLAGLVTINGVAGDVFVGRERELSVLAELLAEVKAGAGGVVLVEGEPGIGKTALLRAGLGGAADAGCRLGWAAGDEFLQRLPLRLMADCVGEQDRLSLARQGDAAGPLAMFGGDPVLAGVEGLLALVDRLCGESPVVLVADDLQWADEPSLVVWQRLVRAAGQLPLLLAGSLRAGAASPELGRLRRGLLASGQLLELGPLEPAKMSELVGRLAGGRAGARLAGATDRLGGNPLYARELVDALARRGRLETNRGIAELPAEEELAVPKSLTAAVAQRLAGLAPDSLGVLRWAAVLGLEFSVSDLVVVTGREASDLVTAVNEILAAQLVTEAGRRLRFRHGLIQQVMYEQMPTALRVALHQQAARALAESGASAEVAGAQLLLAIHGAEPREAADEWMPAWVAGAIPGLVHKAPQMAAELLRAALAQLAPDDPERLKLEVVLARLALFLMENDEVRQVGERVLARAGDPDVLAEINWLIAYVLFRERHTEEASAAITTALARPGIRPIWATRLRALYGLVLAWDGRNDDAMKQAEVALSAAEATGDRLACGYALFGIGVVCWNRRDEAGRLASSERALTLIGEDPQAAELRLMLLAAKGGSLDFLDQREGALATLKEAQALADRTGAESGAICLFLANVYFCMGQWDDAVTEAEAAFALQSSPWVIEALHASLALIAAFRDEQAAASEHLDEVTDPVVDASAWPDADASTLARALLAEASGQPRQAADLLAPCLRPEIAEQMANRFTLLPMLTRLAVSLGDTGLANAAAEAAAHEADREPVPLKVAAHDHCRGLLAGDPAPVQLAADYYEASGRLGDLAIALEDVAVLAAAGDLRTARRAFSAAMRVNAQLGAAWNIRRAAARLGPLGIRRLRGSYQARPLTGWESLTPTEVTVARLVAAGRSNPDIAAELFLSRNTVQTHVSHILEKLGQKSRTQIAVQAARHDAGGASAAAG